MEGESRLVQRPILPSSGTVGLTLLGDRETGTGAVISYDATAGTLMLDRRRSGNIGFHEKFASAESAPISLDDDGALRLRVVVDHCLVEVFAQDGLVAMTDLVFPDGDRRELSVFSEGALTTIRSLTVTELS